eukprot:2191142-Pyramimonas_sp.AAC.1
MRASVELPSGPPDAALSRRDAGEAMGPQNAVLDGALWGHEAQYWVGETHANTATGAFGGAPYMATGH